MPQIIKRTEQCKSLYANCIVKAKIIEICAFSSVAFTQLVTLTYFSRFVIGGLWYIILAFNVLVLFFHCTWFIKFIHTVQIFNINEPF